jgi:hypothetical protein
MTDEDITNTSMVLGLKVDLRMIPSTLSEHFLHLLFAQDILLVNMHVYTFHT